VNKLLAGLGLAVAIAALPAAGLAAAPVEYNKCAAEAASPFEKGFAATGRHDHELKFADAVAECEAALARLPQSLQVKTWLARAYYMAGRDSDAYAILDALPNIRNNPPAATVLGVMLRGSTNVAQDYPRSLELLTAAAEAGFAPAQYYLGSTYDNEYGVTKDLAVAETWYRKAADQQEPRGLAALGSMYLWGDGVVAFDEAEGQRLLGIATEMGDPVAFEYLGIAYANAPNLGQNHDKAAEYFTKAAELGDAFSMVEIGYYYEVGWGVVANPVKAFEWTKKGADAGNAHGYSNLSYYYKNGVGTEVDLPAAFNAALTAAQMGSISGAVNTGWYYLKGIGTEVNCDEALRWTTVAYEANDLDAIENLGEHYHRGCGVEQDLLRARELYQTALDGGSTTAEPLMEELKGLIKTSNLI
jgi:TPR repeat protein